MLEIPFLSISDTIIQFYEQLKPYYDLSSVSAYEVDFGADYDQRVGNPFIVWLLQSRLYEINHQWECAFQRIQRARVIAQTTVDEALTCYMTGQLWNKLGAYQRAIPVLVQAINLAGHTRTLRARAAIACGWAHFFLGHFPVAEGFFQQAVQTASAPSSSPKLTAESYRGLAAVYARTGRYAESKAYLQDAHHALLDDEQHQLSCLNDYGLLARFREDYEKAIELFQQCAFQAAQLRDIDALVRAYNHISESYLRLKQYDNARRYLQLALNLSPFVIRQHQVVVRFLKYAQMERRLALQCQETGDIPRAQKIFIRANTVVEQGLELCATLDDFRLSAQFLQTRARIDQDQGHYIRALQLVHQAIRTLEKIPNHLQTEQDHADREALIQQSALLADQIAVATQSSHPISYQSTPYHAERLNVTPVLYADHLYRQLLAKLQHIHSKKGRIKPHAVARMLSIVQGEWFKNVHFTYTGVAWSTATAHLRILCQAGILERIGTRKAAVYRLKPDVCPLIHQEASPSPHS